MVIAVSAWVTVLGTLVGVVVGVVGGGLATLLIERERWKREDRIRWRPDQRQAYVRFLKAADAYSLAATQFALAVGAQDPGGGGSTEVTWAATELDTRLVALRSEEWEIELVAGLMSERLLHASCILRPRGGVRSSSRRDGETLTTQWLRRRIRRPRRLARRSRSSSVRHGLRSGSE